MLSYLRTTGFSLTFLFVLTIIGCKKSDSSSAIFSGMGGGRHWHGSHYYEASGIHFPTPVLESYNYADTLLSVTIVNDKSVQFMGNTYSYDRTDTVNQIYYFGGAYEYYAYGMGTGLAYYYAKDSIVYCEGDRHSTSDYWELQNLRYTFK